MRKRRIIAVIMSAIMLISTINTSSIYIAAPSEVPPVDVEDFRANLNYRETEIDVDLSFSSENESAIPRNWGTLPHSYSSSKYVDWNFERVNDYITPVKSQNQYGTCWAHSTIAAAEASYIKNEGMTDVTAINFNEYHLIHYTYDIPNDPLGLFGGDYIKLNTSEENPFLNAGGSNDITSMILANWSGASNDTSITADNINDNHADTLAFEDIAHLENAFYIAMPDMSTNSYQDDMRAIKNAIMSYGALAVSYCSTSDGGNEFDGYYYCPVEFQTNHAVTIVGWDDSISASMFETVTGNTPGGNGAWLVKNSWGEYGDLDGYFWLSYYDASISEIAYAYDMVSADNYDNNYQYDGTGLKGYYMDMDTITFANAFVADSQEMLEAVGFYTYDVNVEYEIRVFTALDAGDLPQEGKLALVQTGTEVYAGFHTVELDENILLDEKERYAVVITLKNDGESVHALIDMTIAGGWIESYSYAKMGESYLGSNVESLYDLNSNNTDYAEGVNVRVKAFTNEISMEESDFSYEIQNGEAWLTDYLGTEEIVVVPATLGGYPLVGIRQRAFQYNHDITEIIFSEGLRLMEPESISYCNNLLSISLPSTFGMGANSSGVGGNIYACGNLSEVLVAEGNTSIKSYDGIIYSYDMKSLLFYPPGKRDEVFVIPDGVEIIGSDSCRDNAYVKEIIMPDTVTMIGYWAFIGDSALEKLYISKNCETIGQFAIQGTAIKELVIPASVESIMLWGIFANRKLEHVIVEEGNEYYYSEDGVLYKDTTLVVYPAAKEGTKYVIKDGTTTIGASAFYGSENLVEVELPNSMTTIKEDAFWDCSSLEKINLVDGISVIEEYVFANDDALKNIVFPYALTEIAGNLLNNASVVTIQENVTFIERQSYFNCMETLYFAGDLPENIENVFPKEEREGIFTIYYPSGNKTWTDYIAKCDEENVVWKEHEHIANGIQVEVLPLTAESNGLLGQHCIECGAVCEAEEFGYTDGLFEYTDGDLYYFKDGEVDTTYNGVADYKGNTWYVENGVVNKLINGLQYCGAAWYLFKDGKVNRITTVASNYYGWWYIENGEVNFDYNGVGTNENGTWYIANGKVDFDKNGLHYRGDTWYYFNYGAVDYSFTGMTSNEYGWWYVENGVITFTYDGVGTNEYGTWYFEDSKLDFNVYGLLSRGVDWYYFNGGKVDTSFTGMVCNNYGWWYIENGKLTFDYDGVVTNEYGTWYFNNSQLDFSKDGMHYRSGKWYLFKNGAVNYTTAIASNEYGCWYINNGEVDFNYTGTVVFEGATYYVVNGQAALME